jgi:DNA helicase II / ATP-dependent DNA helicase PcrA
MNGGRHDGPMQVPEIPLPRPLADRLAALAPDQREAATAPPGPVLCVAPAGSGKTTTVVARIAWRIATGADPAGICGLTFNRLAADELRGRVDAALAPLGVAAGTVRIRTFHALGREILDEGGIDVGRLVERSAVLADLAGGPLPAAALRHLDDAFTRLALDPERGPGPEDAATHAAWAAYRAELVRRRAIDFDDLVARAGPVLNGDPALLARWRSRCQVLFVDEAQDLDRAQLDLVLLLTGDRRDVFLVGDDDQTIYAWRLADVRRVLGLAAALPGLRRVDLVTNHRCPPEVVRRAARLVAHGVERFDKRILPSPRAEGILVLAPDPGDPVARARLLLDRWLEAQPGGHAVLARTNAELAPYAALALERGIPWSSAEELLVLDEPALDVALASATRPGPDGRPAGLIAGAGTPAAETRGPGAAPAFDAARVLLAWSAGRPDPAELAAALARARERRAELSAQEPRLTLATVHGTKGLEFDHVAVVGLDEGTFPSRRSIEGSEDPFRTLEEERRLAYVAWTRARRSLTLVYDPSAPSRFLCEAFDAAELVPARRPGRA